jgi:hypothetical protein
MLEELIDKGLLYDVELYRNCFLATFYSLRKDEYRYFKWFGCEDEREAMFKTIKGRWLIAFNNFNYDDAILNHLILNPDITLYDLWLFSQKLIKGERNPYRYNSKFVSYDLLEVIREGYNTKSLKGVAINLKYPTIQDLPIPFEAEITRDQFNELLKYNINDVDILHLIFLHIKKRLEMRRILSEQYGINVHSASDSGIAKELINKFYTEQALLKDPNFKIKDIKYKRTERETINIQDTVLPKIQYQTAIFQEYLNTIKQLTITRISSTETSDKFACDIPKFIYKGKTYTIALGGIHSEDAPLVIKVSGNRLLLDLDVASQYPTAIEVNKVCPKHLDPDCFLPQLSKTKKERIYYKHNKKTNTLYVELEKGLKITLNTEYGLFNSKTYFLFDPLCTFKVTINNQLWLLLLIEMLGEAGYTILSANTDGILLDIVEEDLENVRTIYKQWEQLSGFQLEETNIITYARRDINNYLAEYLEWNKDKQDYDVLIKTKGSFLPQGGILKGFDKPIIAIALQNYYLKGIPPEDTIYNHRDIYDFCSSQKVGKEFVNVLELTKRRLITHRPDKLKRVKVTERVPAIYEEYITKKGTVGKKKISDAVPAIYEEQLVHGEPYVHPQMEDEILEQMFVQKTVRYYISNPDMEDGYLIGYSLKKQKTEDDGSIKRIDYAAGHFVTLFNNFCDFHDFGEYNLDYDYYVSSTWKEIDKTGRI